MLRIGRWSCYVPLSYNKSMTSDFSPKHLNFIIYTYAPLCLWVEPNLYLGVDNREQAQNKIFR